MDFDYSIDQVPIDIEFMSDTSRVWIWPSSRKLSQKEKMQINEYLRQFVADWTSHHQALKAYATVFYDRFIVVVLDEQQSATASGCSIDKLTHFMQHLDEQFEMELFDRLNFQFLIDDQVQNIHKSALSKAYEQGQVNDETFVFDHLIKNKKEFFTKWLKPFDESWHYRFRR